MNVSTNIEILPEDRIKLTNDQKNLIVLAVEKQLPTEDAEFLETIQKDAQKIRDPYAKVKKYFTKKYGEVFGIIYLAAVNGGEESFQKTIHNIEESRALARIKKEDNY